MKRKLTLAHARKLVWRRACALVATDLDVEGAWDALREDLGLGDDAELSAEDAATYQAANEQVVQTLVARHCGGVQPFGPVTR